MFLNDGGAFALLGTTVAPGFDFADFEVGDPRRFDSAVSRRAPR